MAKNWAIVVGINKYNPNNFARLKYAKRDAELMRDFFREAKFDEVYYFADDSPDIVRPDGAEVPTYPSCGNLLSFLHDRFERPFLSAGDNLWFFFAGHGGRYGDRDYLMPIDANPRGSEPTAAILVSDVRDRLCRCGADNVILILDACRNEGSRSSPGIGTEAQQGVITISACSPTQKSWEIDEIQQGAFTKALLEALQIPGERNCATVERLEQYLRFRVPQLCTQYGKFPEQNPRISVDPATKLHFILLPEYALLSDVDTLRSDAYRVAFVDGNLDLAEQLCIRAMAAASGRDMETWQLNNRIQQMKAENVQSTIQPRSEVKPARSEGGERAVSKPQPEVMPVHKREATRPNSKQGTFSHNNSNFLLPTTTTQTFLIAVLIFYSLCGLLIAIASFYRWTFVPPMSAWVVHALVAWAWAWIGADALALSSSELLEEFSELHACFVVAATSGLGLVLGLGLGVSVRWILSV